MVDLTDYKPLAGFDEAIADRCKYTREFADQEIERFEKARKLLREVTQQFLDEGVAYFTSDQLTLLSHVNVNVETHIKQVASDFGRRFVFARPYHSRRYLGPNHPSGEWYQDVTGVLLQVRKGKGADNLVSSLLLSAEALPNEVSVEHYGTRWEFIFNGKTGVGLFHGWREQCKTNKVFRLVLGL